MLSVRFCHHFCSPSRFRDIHRVSPLNSFMSSRSGAGQKCAPKPFAGFPIPGTHTPGYQDVAPLGPGNMRFPVSKLYDILNTIAIVVSFPYKTLIYIRLIRRQANDNVFGDAAARHLDLGVPGPGGGRVYRVDVQCAIIS